MNGNDPKLDHWAEVLARARGYAAKHARRHFVLCDAHVPRGGLVRDGKLLLDFHSFPLRIEEIPDKPKQAQLRVGYTDAFYERSRGGITPSGRRCEHLPYLVEFERLARAAFGSGVGMKSRGSPNNPRNPATSGWAMLGIGCGSRTLTVTCRCPACASSQAPLTANAGMT